MGSRTTIVNTVGCPSKKIIITESTVRRDLQLEDAEGVDCLSNSTIFEQLTLMGSKTTAWNEFSSTMASAIICLAINQKFNFSKYIFESIVKNLDNVGKFLMYPRFIQVFLDKQLEGMPTHNRIYIAPSHTKKIFGNMRRAWKCFSRRETPVFQTMVVQDQAEISEDEAVYKELDDSLVRAITTASSLEAEQDSGNIAKTQSKATPNESSSLGNTSGGGPRHQETMRDTIAQTRFENVSKHSNDPLLARGNTLRSGKDSLKLNELMELCINLQTRVLNLEKTKTTQAEEIVSLKRRVKKLEQKKRSRTHGLKRLYKVGLTARVESFGDKESLGDDAFKQGRINAIDADEDITLVNDQDDADMFDVNTLTGDEVLAEQEVATKDVNLTVDEVTLAQALADLKSVKSKVKGDVVEEPNVPVSATSTKVSAATTTTTAIIPTPRKGTVITELELEKPLKKKDQISIDEQEAIKLQAEFDEEERLAKEKDEANAALTEEWDDIQAKVDVDYQLAQRLQAKEQEQFITKQKATLFKELLKQRRKHFAAKRAEEKRNKPPTNIQQKKTMITYLKNMEDLVEGSSKRAGDELEQEVTKKKKVDDVQETAKVDDDQEAAKIKELMKIVPDEEEVAIDVIPLATKPPTIVNWKIHKEGKKNYYQIIRADGSSMILVEDLDLILWGDLKTMFEPHVEDRVWRNQQDYRVLDWKLYDSCGVHSLRMQHIHIYMLVEKRYPLTPATITDMLNKKLQFYLNPRPQNQNEPPKQNPFTFRERTGPNPQPQALGTTFEALVRYYIAAHTERMERFENAISKQRKEVKDRMAELFGLLKELTTNRALEKVLIREGAKSPITKNVNSISLTRGEEEKSDKDDVSTGDNIEKTIRLDTEMPVKEAETENGAENRIKNEPIKRDEKEEGVEAPSSQPVEYYLKHKINEKLIEALVDNHMFNDSLSRVRVGKVKGKTYTLSPRGPVYEAILKKKITRKEDIGGNFEIPCNIGGLKRMNILVDQRSDVNVMPISTYMKLTDEWHAETDIRLSIASHSYIYPLGIAEDVLFDVAGFVYLVNFVNLDIKEDKKRPFILGTPFLTKAKAVIKLYLMRRSLEVLRKFHWAILGGRFNQFSHVSSPLLSKPGEY
ncbi:retrovirus-related pol polyprotein from transposon TNT 1-94 [Tanacetum coccineum]